MQKNDWLIEIKNQQAKQTKNGHESTLFEHYVKALGSIIHDYSRAIKIQSQRERSESEIGSAFLIPKI